MKLACKPGSVQGFSPWAVIPLDHRLPGGSSSLPGSSASDALAPLFGLAPDGVWRAAPVTRSAVGSYPQPARRRAAAHLAVARTISPLPEPRNAGPSAVYFLFHFPSPRGARPLAGILLCGARTFLCTGKLYSDCPASFTRLSYLSCAKCGRRDQQIGPEREFSFAGF